MSALGFWGLAAPRSPPWLLAVSLPVPLSCSAHCAGKSVIIVVTLVALDARLLIVCVAISCVAVLGLTYSVLRGGWVYGALLGG